MIPPSRKLLAFVAAVGVSLTACYLRSIGVADAPFVWTIDTGSRLTQRFGVLSLSSTVGLDSSGTVRFANDGPVEGALLVRQIRTLR